MESLIYENFKTGNAVEVFLKGSQFPIEAKFMKCSRGGMLLRTESGRKIVLPLSEVLMVKQAPNSLPKSPSASKERPFTTGKTFTPSVTQANSQPSPAVPDASDSPEALENTPAEDKPADAPQTISPEPKPEDPNLFKLPSEKPQLKILGSIELDDSERNRKRFKTYEPVSFSRPELAEDFLDTQMHAMGILKSIGPVYGYIKVEGQPDIYVNRGEFIFLPGETTQLEPGMPVFYSVGSNWKGMMAKCVHRPYTVGEQLDLIENVISTDVRNARLLASQLTEAFPDNEEVADALEAFPQI